MTSQTVFVLTVDTENYAGNFERELGAYCTGCVHEYDHSGIAAIAAAAAQEMRFGQWWVEHITAHQGVDEEYPPVYFNVAETPRWVMDGCGADYPAGSAEAQKIAYPSPSLMSVSVAVWELPPAEVWAEFVQRAQDFCAQKYNDAVRARVCSPEAIVFTGARQEEVVTTVTVARKMVV